MVSWRILAGTALGLVLSAGVAAGGYYAGQAIADSNPPARVTAERLLDIPVLLPRRGEPKGLVIQISDRGGLSPRDTRFGDRLRAEGMAVLPVDLEDWREKLDADDGECLYLGSDLELLAKEALRTIGGNSYFHPVVVGRGEGGTLAYAALADAPPATLGGAVALDPAQTLDTRLPVCEGAKATKVEDSQFSYALDAPLPENATLLSAQSMTGLASGEAPSGSFFAVNTVEPDNKKRETDAVSRVVELADDDATSGALPIVDIPSDGRPEAVVLFYSGDGGWRDLDKTIGDALAEKGLHVIGVDSLRYFWNVRTPQEIARDAEAMIKMADPSGKLPVAVYGYSFGADTFPFAWQYLPDAIKHRIRMVALLGTEETTTFQVTVGGWLGIGGDYEVVPEIRKIPLERVVCIYGEDEDLTACTDPRLKGMELIKTEGGHHFDGDYDALADRLYQALKTRLGQAPTTG
ncbi:virulence factor family protein [Mesorhizobium sp. RP14(2022)]|uniref:Virulence factor family protein n=1 Tax=Mesorhizobium liriopis TaxID=2953882 RepID=A0ABT1C003_9HYPH|nr:AcvB/VirJ family lysyl-phosphatidylglycerol hydrolase [Mesorhizobium liriopis]MCO6048177.1 virulence factor family protein [Mesorhizobium liriopis]